MAFEIVTLKVGSLVLRPVTIAIEIAMDEAARSFEAKVKHPDLQQAALLDALAGRPACTIHSLASDGVSQASGEGGDLLLTGFVEKRSPSLRSAESELPISGRSKTGDTVDSAADHDSGEFREKTAKDVLGTLAKKQDVEVESDLDHPKRPLFRLRPGERIFDAAERWARAEGFAIGDTADGKLKLAKAGQQRHAGGLTEGVNVVDASAVHDDSKRFGTVKVRAQAPSGYTPDELQIEAEASDNVGGKRLKVIVPPEQIRKADARQRAKWHRDRAAGEGTTCEVTTSGWRDAAGRLWTPGLLVFVEIPTLGIVQDMLVKKVSLKQDDTESAGTQAALSLVDPRAFGGKSGKGSKSGKALDLGKAGGDDAE